MTKIAIGRKAVGFTIAPNTNQLPVIQTINKENKTRFHIMILIICCGIEKEEAAEVFLK